MRETRFDAMPLSGGLTEFVTPQAAHEHLAGQKSSAAEARLRMLQRMGLDREDGPAVDAREAIRRQRHR